MANVKGSQVLGVVKTLRTYRTQALALLPSEFHQYLDERIVVSDWYPSEVHRELMVTMAQILAPTLPGDIYMIIGEAGAKRDLSATYASLVRENDPEGTLQRAVAGWRLVHDSGEFKMIVTSPKSARIELHDYDGICPEIAKVNAGYYVGMLRAAGARAPVVKVVAVMPPKLGPTVWSADW